MNFTKMKTFDKMISSAIEAGASKAAIIEASKIETDAVFRQMCASNACGMYGKCYMCPPDVGDIDTLMAKIKEYDYALVYQTISALEDSYDYEGMVDAKKSFYHLTQRIKAVFCDRTDALHLGTGGCGTCEDCAKKIGEPCRAPSLATPSLEAYGINVSRLAASAGMKYTNGQDTVTYFGAVLFKD